MTDVDGIAKVFYSIDNDTYLFLLKEWSGAADSGVTVDIKSLKKLNINVKSQLFEWVTASHENSISSSIVTNRSGRVSGIISTANRSSSENNNESSTFSECQPENITLLKPQNGRFVTRYFGGFSTCTQSALSDSHSNALYNFKKIPDLSEIVSMALTENREPDKLLINEIKSSKIQGAIQQLCSSLIEQTQMDMDSIDNLSKSEKTLSQILVNLEKIQSTVTSDSLLADIRTSILNVVKTIKNIPASEEIEKITSYYNTWSNQIFYVIKQLPKSGQFDDKIYQYVYEVRQGMATAIVVANYPIFSQQGFSKITAIQLSDVTIKLKPELGSFTQTAKVYYIPTKDEMNRREAFFDRKKEIDKIIQETSNLRDSFLVYRKAAINRLISPNH